MSLIERYNNLDGVETSRGEIRKIINLAQKEGRKDIVFKLTNLLKQNPDFKLFNISLEQKALGSINAELNGLDYIEDQDEGLGKAITPDEIYDYVTDMIIDLIESGEELVWKQQWDKEVSGEAGTIATNYSTKKAYRGINFFLLNFIIPLIRGKEWSNPYFLTFKQIEENKGKLKKGSKGYRVLYFTKLFSFISSAEKIYISSYNRAKFIKQLNLSNAKILKEFSASEVADRYYFPILKYYNVFSADDIEGIDFKTVKVEPKKEEEKIEIAESIINSMPKAPIIKKQGTEAFYLPSKDVVNVPKITTFKTPQAYYSTLFHELIHSTKHPKRLNDNTRGGKKFGDKEYSREELVAELGASFLNAEAGILHHNLKNSAAYLKGWRKRLLQFMKEDNKFFFRAASKAQAAADYILDRDKKGIPVYVKSMETMNKLVNKAQKGVKKPKEKKVNKKTKQMALFGGDKGSNELKGLGFVSAATNLEPPKDIFRLAGAIGDFIQDIQPHQALILIKGTKHTSKSQLAMQFAEGFSLTGRKVAYIDYEQGGLESKDTVQSLNRNTTHKGRQNIFVKGYIDNPMQELENIIKFVDVIVADSVTDLGLTADQLNYLRKTYPKVLWCFISQVKENGAMYGGNKMAHNPTAIVQCHPATDPKDRYATLEKNRGNDLNLCYDIFQKKVFAFKEVEETQDDEKVIKTIRDYKQ